MSSTAKLGLIVLWEDEIRAAAAAIAAFRKAADDEKTPDEEVNRLAGVAIATCEAALYRADEEGAGLVLTSMPRPRRRR